MRNQFLEFTKIDLNNDKQGIILNFNEISSVIENDGFGRHEAEVNMNNGNKHFVLETFPMILEAIKECV